MKKSVNTKKISFGQLEKAIRTCHGRIYFASKMLDITPPTLYLRIKQDCNLQKIVDEAREQAHDMAIDQAESVIEKTMQMIEDNPNISLRSAMYTLDKKGRNRGWGDIKRDDSETDALLGTLNDNLLKEREKEQHNWNS